MEKYKLHQLFKEIDEMREENDDLKLVKIRIETEIYYLKRKLHEASRKGLIESLRGDME